jgi:hypothetical protein
LADIVPEKLAGSLAPGAMRRKNVLFFKHLRRSAQKWGQSFFIAGLMAIKKR